MAATKYPENVALLVVGCLVLAPNAWVLLLPRHRMGGGEEGYRHLRHHFAYQILSSFSE